LPRSDAPRHETDTYICRPPKKPPRSKNLFFTNSSGLTVEEITKLRNELRKDGATATYGVVKNTLFSIAAGPEMAKELETFLAGPTGVVFGGDDPVTPAKALQAFNAVKPVEVKAAWIDGKIATAADVTALASLPPKQELLAKLVGSLKSPLYGLVMVLSGNQSGLVRVLNAIREQKAAGAPASAEPEVAIATESPAADATAVPEAAQE
jgi:large subunit ribosomal protein L10